MLRWLGRPGDAAALLEALGLTWDSTESTLADVARSSPPRLRPVLASCSPTRLPAHASSS